MSTLYHKLGRLSRAKCFFYKLFYWAFITSAPTRPIKQAPTSKTKNVISISFILLYIIGTVKPITLIKSGKSRSFFLKTIVVSPLIATTYGDGGGPHSVFLNLLYTPNLKSFAGGRIPVGSPVDCYKLFSVSDKLFFTNTISYPKFIKLHDFTSDSSQLLPFAILGLSVPPISKYCFPSSGLSSAGLLD
jgi:hypothetical protein